MNGFTYTQLVEEGFIVDQDDKNCFAEALTDPAKYAEQTPDAETGGCYLSDEFVEMINERVRNIENGTNLTGANLTKADLTGATMPDGTVHD